MPDSVNPGPMGRRAPYPNRPRLDVARLLRQALAASWSDFRHGQHYRAYQTLESAIVGSIPDLEAYGLDHWESIAAELQEARPPDPA